MTDHRRVVWTEGMLLRPQHLQQMERSVGRALQIRGSSLRGEDWGFVELELQTDLLMTGQLALRRARGLFPDGTPFVMPEDDPLPLPMDVGIDVRNQTVYLALPLRRGGVPETDIAAAADSFARYGVEKIQVRHAVAGYSEEAPVDVGMLRTRLVLGSQPHEGYGRIPVAHILERRSDGRVVLDNGFMPSALACHAVPRLQEFLVELQGLLHQRADLLALRAVATGRAASAEIAEYLMLMIMNRFEPVFVHFARARSVHPEDAYVRMLELAGELATLTRKGTRRPISFPPYRQEHLQLSFDPLIDALREAFIEGTDSAAVPITLKFKNGAYLGQIGDRSLMDSAMFVIAVRADIERNKLSAALPNYVKIAERDGLAVLVHNALPGIGLHLLPTAPRQIPMVHGGVYFELVQGGELWLKLRQTGQIAVFVQDRERAFPGFDIELWAIKV
jgi:type VI secretion system protein ImpJ